MSSKTNKRKFVEGNVDDVMNYDILFRMFTEQQHDVPYIIQAYDILDQYAVTGGLKTIAVMMNKKGGLKVAQRNVSNKIKLIQTILKSLGFRDDDILWILRERNPIDEMDVPMPSFESLQVEQVPPIQENQPPPEDEEIVREEIALQPFIPMSVYEDVEVDSDIDLPPFMLSMPPLVPIKREEIASLPSTTEMSIVDVIDLVSEDEVDPSDKREQLYSLPSSKDQVDLTTEEEPVKKSLKRKPPSEQVEERVNKSRTRTKASSILQPVASEQDIERLFSHPDFTFMEFQIENLFKK